MQTDSNQHRESATALNKATATALGIDALETLDEVPLLNDAQRCEEETGHNDHVTIYRREDCLKSDVGRSGNGGHASDVVRHRERVGLAKPANDHRVRGIEVAAAFELTTRHDRDSELGA